VPNALWTSRTVLLVAVLSTRPITRAEERGQLLYAAAADRARRREKHLEKRCRA
jgi:hypothetical protein